MRQTHRLKCWTEYFEEVEFGNKLFELRKDDRPWVIGDLLMLEHWDQIGGQYSGRHLYFNITYILRNAQHFGLMEGFCILSLEAENDVEDFK